MDKLDRSARREFMDRFNSPNDTIVRRIEYRYDATESREATLTISASACDLSSHSSDLVAVDDFRRPDFYVIEEAFAWQAEQYSKGWCVE